MRFRGPTNVRRRRAKRPEPLPWKYNWRNPNMVVCTRIFQEVGMLSGVFEKKAVELKPDEMQEMCQESMQASTNPTWNRDKTYY